MKEKGKTVLDAFVETHVRYMSGLVNSWLLGTDNLLAEIDFATRKQTMNELVKRLKKRIHYP